MLCITGDLKETPKTLWFLPISSSPRTSIASEFLVIKLSKIQHLEQSQLAIFLLS